MNKGKNTWKWMRLTAVMGILLASFQNCDSTHMLGSDMSSSGGEGFNQAVFNQKQAEATAVLTNRCASCHDGTVGGDTPDVLDFTGLRASGYIVPGAPQNSPIYLTIVDGSMPQGGPNLAGTLEAIAIRDWIQMMP